MVRDLKWDTCRYTRFEASARAISSQPIQVKPVWGVCWCSRCVWHCLVSAKRLKPLFTQMCWNRRPRACSHACMHVRQETLNTFFARSSLFESRLDAGYWACAALKGEARCWRRRDAWNLGPSLSSLSYQTTRKPLGFGVTTTMNNTVYADEHLGFLLMSLHIASLYLFQHQGASS